MKKVLFVVESLGGGGAEKVLTTLVRKLDKTKFDITVLTVVKTGVYINEISKYCRLQYMLPDYGQIHNVFDKIKYKLEYKWIYSESTEKVYSKYVTEKYDVEIGFVEGFATKFVAASNNSVSKKICWLHIDMEKNPYADESYRSLEDERAVYQKFNRIVGVSNSVKTAFERKFSLPDSVTVLYNLIDSEEIVSKAMHEAVEKPNGLTMVSIGRLEMQKGYDRLIRSLAANRTVNADYTLWIIGEGSQRNMLQELIAASGLEDHVKLIGFKRNPYPWIMASDVFICSSRAEGYSLAIAEAMLLGKPILSVDCAGPNELLGFGRYGKLIPNTDEALQKMVAELLSGQIDLAEYAKLSIQRQSFFDVDGVIGQMEALL